MTDVEPIMNVSYACYVDMSAINDLEIVRANITITKTQTINVGIYLKGAIVFTEKSICEFNTKSKIQYQVVIVFP